MKRENIEKFVNYGNKLPDDAVGCITIGQLMASLLVVGLGYNYIISLLSVLPCIVLTIIFYGIYRIVNIKNKLLLFFGIQAIMISLTLQVGGFVFIPLSKGKLLAIVLSCLAADLIIPILMVVVAKLMINHMGKLPSPVTAAAIAPFAALGSSLGVTLRNESKVFICVALLLLAVCFLVFFIYIVKYYYACLLEKL